MRCRMVFYISVSTLNPSCYCGYEGRFLCVRIQPADLVDEWHETPLTSSVVMSPKHTNRTYENIHKLTDSPSAVQSDLFTCPHRRHAHHLSRKQDVVTWPVWWGERQLWSICLRVSVSGSLRARRDVCLAKPESWGGVLFWRATGSEVIRGHQGRGGKWWLTVRTFNVSRRSVSG